jgi:starch synthase (maltosyl-transferring)
VPVSLVITDLDVGGAERSLVALALGLNRARWKPSVIALGPEGALAAPLTSAGIETVCLNVNRRRPFAAVRRLRAALKTQNPSIIQSFLFHANIAARLAARSAGSPPVVSGLRVAECEKRWHLWVDRWTSRWSAGAVCVSQGVLWHALGHRLRPPERFVVIPNGVDPAPFDAATPVDRTSLGLSDADRFILYVGRIERQKGVEMLLRAAREVASERADAHFVIVGDGPLRQRLESETGSDQTLAPRVQWLGRRDDVPRLLRTCELLVLPSLWEGMPNVVLEAMAARKAVVATSVEGSEELVIPGKTGWLVPPGDAKAIARAMLDALSDTARLLEFGESGRSRVERKFSQSAAVAAYEQYWAKLLGFGPIDVDADR